MPRLTETLGMMPSGTVKELSGDGLRTYLMDKYLGNEDEKKRQTEALKRLDYYRDRSRPYIEQSVRDLFKNEKVQQLRLDMVPYGLFQNLTKRLTNDVSTVYADRANRVIKGPNERYQDFQRALKMDRRMRSVNRHTNLLNDVLVHFRIRPDGTPVQDVITPDRFWAISHPNDPTWFVGAIISQYPRGQETNPNDRYYLVVSDTEYFYLNRDGYPMGETTVEHGLGRLPVILNQKDPPEDGLLDGTSGNDLTSGHSTIALLNILMMKHQKSGTRIAYATGDTSDIARDQAMDEEVMIETGEGVALNTLDMGSDPNNYINAARAVIKQIAANRGVSETMFDLSYQATSGFEIELKRIGLTEIRKEQLIDYRPLEADLAQLQSQVLLAARHPLAFAVSGWAIDFGEVETPVEPMAQLDYIEKAIKMGLQNIVEAYMHQNPEATASEAAKVVLLNDEIRIDRMQRFQSENQGTFAPTQNEGARVEDEEG